VIHGIARAGEGKMAEQQRSRSRGTIAHRRDRNILGCAACRAQQRQHLPNALCVPFPPALRMAAFTALLPTARYRLAGVKAAGGGRRRFRCEKKKISRRWAVRRKAAHSFVINRHFSSMKSM